jgi:hypothetical protein
LKPSAPVMKTMVDFTANAGCCAIAICAIPTTNKDRTRGRAQIMNASIVICAGRPAQNSGGWRTLEFSTTKGCPIFERFVLEGWACPKARSLSQSAPVGTAETLAQCLSAPPFLKTPSPNRAFPPHPQKTLSANRVLEKTASKTLSANREIASKLTFRCTKREIHAPAGRHLPRNRHLQVHESQNSQSAHFRVFPIRKNVHLWVHTRRAGSRQAN